MGDALNPGPEAAEDLFADHPEIAEALQPLGWALARLDPELEFEAFLTLTPSGGQLGGATRTESRKALAAIRWAIKSVEEAECALIDLSDGRQLLVEAVDPLPFIEGEGRQELDLKEVVQELAGLHFRLQEVEERLSSEAGGAGGERNHAAYAVADVLADVHVMGLGTRPRAGSDWDHQGINGDFGKAVQEVLSILKIECADVRRPCKAAQDGLTEERMRSLLARRARLLEPESGR